MKQSRGEADFAKETIDHVDLETAIIRLEEAEQRYAFSFRFRSEMRFVCAPVRASPH